MLSADLQRERVDVLAGKLTEVGEVWVCGCEWLADTAAELSKVDAEYRAALSAAGEHDRRPLAREMAVEVLHGKLGSLRPYLPTVTELSADRAAECLTSSYEREEMW